VARTEDTTPATNGTHPAAASMAQRLLGRLRHARYLFSLAVVSTLLAAALVMLYVLIRLMLVVLMPADGFQSSG
jgi:hypothetical protein